LIKICYLEHKSEQTGSSYSSTSCDGKDEEGYTPRSNTGSGDDQQESTRDMNSLAQLNPSQQAVAPPLAETQLTTKESGALVCNQINGLESEKGTLTHQLFIDLILRMLNIK